MLYPAATWERAMKVQEVMLKALSGQPHWFRAVEILGMHPRSSRRWRERYERYGYDGFLDRRRRRSAVRRVPTAEVTRVLQLYRERYQGFNVRHFHEVARQDHGVTLSYSYVKQALQTAGLVKKRRPRGRHFRPAGAASLFWRAAPSRWEPPSVVGAGPRAPTRRARRPRTAKMPKRTDHMSNTTGQVTC